jgi:phosphoribosylformimino-5-aminoimidazole carboxamide ribotide isomerase
MHGRAVHARRGERQQYRPVDSPLCRSGVPQDAAQALLALYPFPRLYIADIDAIRKTGTHQTIIGDIRDCHPQTHIWLDAGVGNIDDLGSAETMEVDCIIGSESLHNLDDFLQLRARCGARAILSLDFTAHGYQGPPTLLHDTTLWPDIVIAMTLARVGSDAGPDIPKLKQIRKMTDKQLYAAGGVRGIEDVRALQQLGADGVLVASALHTCKLTHHEIEAIMAHG